MVDRRLKTATAIADPVLVYIERPGGAIALLANDVIFDRADVIRLQNVRGVRVREGMRRLLGRRAAEFHSNEVQLRRHGERYFAVDEGRVIAPASETPFSMENISAARYHDLLSATPISVYQAASPYIPHEPRGKPRRGMIARALRAVRLATVPALSLR